DRRRHRHRYSPQREERLHAALFVPRAQREVSRASHRGRRVAADVPDRARRLPPADGLELGAREVPAPTGTSEVPDAAHRRLVVGPLEASADERDEARPARPPGQAVAGRADLRVKKYTMELSSHPKSGPTMAPATTMWAIAWPRFLPSGG